MFISGKDNNYCNIN